ncbi:oard1_1 [Blepharisma stoltei]|uniref:Macro domain-containing protein n=1 Tax=Blepharisma stoltei TaxID=1481888 RepID=A0AAU9IIP2_9CILI|nr:unnamed protein product [Blepharisma stoltei]
MASSNITLVTGNLFNASETYSLAHCVSKDLEMSKGIALEFRNRFGKIDDLQSQSPEIGKTLVLHIGNGRFAFYLITKDKYFQKPTYSNLQRSLVDLRNKCLDMSINKLAMPKIGCGLDKLKWDKVYQTINQVFCETNIEILIYSFKDINSLNNMGEKSKLPVTKLQLAKIFSLGAAFFGEASKALKNKPTKKISIKEDKPAREKSESPSKPKQKKPKIDLSPTPGTGLWAYMEERLKILKREPLHIGTQESVLKKIIVNEWRGMDKIDKDRWNENGLNELQKRNKEASKTPVTSPAKEQGLSAPSKPEEVKQQTPLKTPSKEEKKSHHKDEHRSEHKSKKKSEKKRSRSRSRSSSSSESEEERSHKKKHRHKRRSDSESESSGNEKSKKKHKRSK